MQISVNKEAQRLKQAEQHQHSLLIYSSYIGALGLVLVLPIVAGAYLGRWLDSFDTGFSISWTISLIIIGVITGAVNAYYLIKGKH
ncbi:MAG: AtpZ/AtpI family protein [Gammaproteobacteria bacterium]|nr:AtpZ/AtpI family protein [Gammaproteobacteria bacterium]